ncbi:hypothetical protein B0H19DRAFT_1140893, partial [Mycena capillaripes]
MQPVCMILCKLAMVTRAERAHQTASRRWHGIFVVIGGGLKCFETDRTKRRWWNKEKSSRNSES